MVFGMGSWNYIKGHGFRDLTGRWEFSDMCLSSMLKIRTSGSVDDMEESLGGAMLRSFADVLRQTWWKGNFWAGWWI